MSFDEDIRITERTLRLLSPEESAKMLAENLRVEETWKFIKLVTGLMATEMLQEVLDAVLSQNASLEVRRARECTIHNAHGQFLTFREPSARLEISIADGATLYMDLPGG